MRDEILARIIKRSEDIASEPPRSSRRRCERHHCLHQIKKDRLNFMKQALPGLKNDQIASSLNQREEARRGLFAQFSRHNPRIVL